MRPSGREARFVLDDRLLEMSRTMKARGILMHTITFGPSPDATLPATCASKAHQRLPAAPGSELEEHSVQIAGKSSALRFAA